MTETTQENEKKFDQLFKKFQSVANMFFWLYIILGVPLVAMELFGSTEWSDRAHQAMTVLILVTAATFFGGMGYMFYKVGKLGLRPKRN